MSLGTFLAELRRRRVFRVAVVYAGVAFILFQIVDATFEPLRLPDWLGTAVVVLLLLGFPIAVGLAWAFDLTDKGVVRTVAEETVEDKAPAPTETVSRPKPRYFSLSSTILGAMVLAALGYFFLIAPRLEGGEPVPTAVVDFVNETDEPELNGLSGMLITALEQSRRLAVCTRSRMFDILKQLGKNNVDHIDETLGREIARQAHLEALVIASIRKFGQLYTIDLKVLDPKGDEYLFTAREEGTGQESIPGMLDRLAAKTRKGLKERSRDIEARTPQVAAVTTPNLEAYQHYFKGEEYINKLKFDDAVQEFEAAVHLDSTFALAYYRLAYAISWNMGSEQLAMDPIQKAFALIDRVPDKIKYLLRAEKALVEEGMEAGLAVLREMEQIYPDDKEMIYNIGDWSYHIREYATAAKYMEKTLALDPPFERALQHLTWIYRDTGQYEKALEVAERYMSVVGSDESYRLLIEIHFPTGSFNEVLKLAESRLSINPADIDARLASGDCYIYLGQVEKGFAAYDVALVHALGTTREQAVYDYRAGANLYLGRYQEAMEDYRHLIEYTMNPPPGIKPPLDAYMFRLARGHIQDVRRDYQAAVSEFKEATVLRPTVLRIYRDLGATYARMGKIGKAQAVADTILKRLHGRPNRYYHHVAGHIALAKIDYQTAIRHFEGLCSENKLIFYCYPIVKTRALSGDVHAAIDELEDMLVWGRATMDYGSYSPLIYPYALYTLGTLYEQTGETTRAIQTYEQLLGIWKDADEDIPELIDARTRYERLKATVES